jgi:hypothetical protein
VSIFSITYQDIVNFSSKAVVDACFDDGNGGNPQNNPAVPAVIDRGEQEVLSWLGDELGPPPFNATILAQIGGDPFLKYAAIEYVMLYVYDRHPEYVRSGMKDRAARKESADLRMQRVLDARQRPPTVPTPPANVGGVAVDRSHRIITTGPEGGPGRGYHGGDYGD